MIEQTATIMHEIVSELERMPEAKVIEVLDFVRFLRTRPESVYAKRHTPRILSETQLAQLYSKAAEEDRQLAETGISEYAASLKSEDADAKR